MTKFEYVKEMIKMTDVLEYYGIKRFRGGGYLCPFHKDKNPSASIDKGKWFHCFSCGINIDIFDFVAKYENCNRKDAFQKLDYIFNLGLGNKLSKQQQEEIKLARARVDREKARRQLEEQREKLALDKVLEEIKFWEQIQDNCHPTRGEVRTGTWVLSDTFFKSLQLQEWMRWVYLKICGIEHAECEFDHCGWSYLDKTEIINKVLDGELNPCHKNLTHPIAD